MEEWTAVHIILRLAISHECNAMSLTFLQHQKRLQKVLNLNTLLFDNMVKSNKHFFKKKAHNFFFAKYSGLYSLSLSALSAGLSSGKRKILELGGLHS